MVFRCPCGTDPIKRSPRGQRALGRTMLVLLAVSSMNTNRAGFSMSCAFLQRRRARATSRRCCSAACRAFFKGEIMSLEEPPNPSAAAGDSSLAHRGHDLIQRQIRLLGDQRQQPFRVLLQWRLAPSARLRFDGSSIVPAPPPSHRRTWAQPEVLSRLARGCPGFDCFDHAFTQVLRIWLRHRSGPPKPNQCLQTRSPIGTSESPRFKPSGICSKPIRGEVWRIRTLCPFDRKRRTLAERESTLDGIVDITLEDVYVGRDKVRVPRLVRL